MPSGRDLHSGGTRVLSVALLLLGVAIVVRTLIAGGGLLATRLILGVLLAAAGAARLYIASRG